MALARSSDVDERINIKRLNLIMIQNPQKLMNTQMIINVYERLFDEFRTVFQTTMFDVYNDDETWVTEEMMEVNANISYAICIILNDLPVEAIKMILKGYTDDFSHIHCGDRSKIRFSMKSLSDDFSRINAIVELLESEGYSVP